jgi:hypothetical protein
MPLPRSMTKWLHLDKLRCLSPFEFTPEFNKAIDFNNENPNDKENSQSESKLVEEEEEEEEET